MLNDGGRGKIVFEANPSRTQSGKINGDEDNTDAAGTRRCDIDGSKIVGLAVVAAVATVSRTRLCVRARSDHGCIKEVLIYLTA